MKIAQLSRYAMFALGLLVILGVGQHYITTLIGVAYPAFQSFCILDAGNEALEKQWLTYWVVYGCFEILDHFAGFILTIIPFYYVGKMFFIIYLANYGGATFVYDNYLRAYFVDALQKVDDSTADVYNSASAKLQAAQDAAASVTSKV